MAKKLAPAHTVARQRSNNGIWLDHAEITDEDYTWLASAERLTLWNVRVPSGFLARLGKLWWLDIRGGSAVDLNVAHGTHGLQYLAVNQIRGMQDLSVVGEMLNLRRIDLYGLPQVTSLPSFAAHAKLEHAEIGQLGGLNSLHGILQAPSLRELQLIRKMNVTAEDIVGIKNHPSLKQFGWVAEDVPLRIWKPVMDQIHLQAPATKHPEDWFGLTNP